MAENLVKPHIHRRDGRPAVLTTDIALAFGRRHNDLVIVIRKHIAEGRDRGFYEHPYADSQGRNQPAFLVNLDGFDTLTSGWRRPGDTDRRSQWLVTFKALDAQTSSSIENQEGLPKPETDLPNSGLIDRVSPNLSELEAVDFHGQTLFLVEHRGEPYVPMRPVVEGMGLDWKSQYRRITDRFQTCVVIMTTQVPGDTQKRDVTCLPLKKVFGWLMTIQPSRVKTSIRDRVIQYQDECDEALWNYWTHGRADNPRATDLVLSHNEARYLYFLKATHGLSGHSSHQPKRNQVSPNGAAVLWFLDQRTPDTQDGWHRCTVREIANALNLNPGNVSTLIRILNGWGFVDTKHLGRGKRSEHRLSLSTIEKAVASSPFDDAFGQFLAKLPDQSGSQLH